MAAFQDLKLRKKYRFVTFCLGDENRKIIIEKTAEKDTSYEEFLSGLPDDDCRYAIYDFEYQKSADEGLRSKICFIVW